MLGLLMGMDGLTQEALVLIPVVSDSTRKLAYILRRSDVNVHTIDIPPRKGGMALQNYVRQLELCVELLSAHTGRRFSPRTLRRSASLVAYAHRELRRFRTLTAAQPGLFTASWRMLIGFSYYCAHDLVKWIELLVNLNNRIENSRMHVAGKTGTANDYRDLTFAGYTPYYTAAIWAGYDDPQELPRSHRSFHRTLWRNVMNRIHDDLPDRDFQQPSTVERATVCAESGLLAGRGCIRVNEYFDEHNMPRGTCTQHRPSLFSGWDNRQNRNSYDNMLR